MLRKLRIKFVSKYSIDHAHFTRLPNRHSNMEFVPDATARNYDWFVVYGDLPRSRDERFPLSSEKLACPARNTILLTYEPSSVKFYGDDFVNQFGYVLTSHEPATLSHADRHDAPPVGVWLYGGVADALRHTLPPEKARQICIFRSSKKMRNTLHRKRFNFQEALLRLMPELDIYGRDFRRVEKKAECLDHYRYTVALENHVGPHHWTEKLSDSFLGYCLPFYFGCPNTASYFPEESFIRIDIEDPRGAAETIREALASGEYERRLPAIVEARRRVIEEYNLPNVVGDLIAKADAAGQIGAGGRWPHTRCIHSSLRLRLRRPIVGLRYVLLKQTRLRQARAAGRSRLRV